MKIDLHTDIYLVFKPGPDTEEEEDLFDGKPIDLGHFLEKVQAGLDIYNIHGMYTSKEEAVKEVKKIFGFQESEEVRFKKFVKGLTELSTKHGIAIQSTGGVYFFDRPIPINYSDDHTSGDLEAYWDERFWE